MKLGRVLYEPKRELRYVFFPKTSIVPLPYVMKDIVK
jgi:hypothetical protein